MKSVNNKTKNTIMQIAIALFKEKGYANVSVNEIAEACDISKAGFYYHFKSKDELISEYYNHIYTQSQDDLLKLLTIKSDVEKLWALLLPAIDYTISNGPDILSQVFKTNLDCDKGTFSFEDDKLREVCAKLIREGQKSGEIKNNSNAESLFESICYKIIGIAVVWCIKDGSFDEKELIRKHFNTLLGLNINEEVAPDRNSART